MSARRTDDFENETLDELIHGHGHTVKREENAPLSLQADAPIAAVPRPSPPGEPSGDTFSPRRTLGQIARERLVTSALAYARLGWPVFPLTPGGKRPLGKLAPRGFLNATTNEAQIREWWSACPDAGIGVPTGRISGVVALDTDPRSGGDETLRQLLDEHRDLPKTAESITGGGGWHSLFRYPESGVPSKKGLRPGLDLKSDGGYIVVDPSLHPDGDVYQWAPDLSPWEVPLAEMPEWLRAMAGQAGGSDTSGAHESKTWEQLPEEAAQQDDYLHSVAGKAIRGLPEDAWLIVKHTIRGAMKNLPVRDPNRPWTEADVERHYASIVKEEQARRSHLEMQKTPQKETGRTLMSKEFAPLNWIVTHFLPEGFILLGGKPKSGKTLLQDKLALAAGSGMPFWTDVPSSRTHLGEMTSLRQFVTQKRNVLFLSLEDGEPRTQRRIKDLLASRPEYESALDSIEFWFTCPLAEDGGIDSIKEWLDAHPGGLVLIDHYWRFLKGTDSEGNIAQKDYRAMMTLHDLVRDHPGSGLMLSIHLTKQAGRAINKGEDIFDCFQGTMGNVAAPDLMLALVRYEKTQGRLYCRGRDLAEGDTDFALKISEGGSWEIRGQEEVSPDVSSAILGALGEVKGEMLSRPAIISKTGFGRTTVSEALKALEKAGKVTATGRTSSRRYGLQGDPPQAAAS